MGRKREPFSIEFFFLIHPKISGHCYFLRVLSYEEEEGKLSDF